MSLYARFYTEEEFDSEQGSPFLTVRVDSQLLPFQIGWEFPFEGRSFRITRIIVFLGKSGVLIRHVSGWRIVAVPSK